MSVEPILVDPVSQRMALAERIRVQTDIKFPRLDYWNYEPCPHHEEPIPGCQYRLCGGDLFAHQKVGISWLYLREKGLLADVTGSGKTNQVFGLLALMKQRGELTDRALIVCQTPATSQWLREGQRWVPRMALGGILSGMTKSQRVDEYVRNFDVLVTGYHLMMRDKVILERLQFGTVVVDDVDPVLNHANRTHKDLEMLTRSARRVVVINATTIQIRLQQLHAATMLTDGLEVFGTLRQFERRYVRQEPVTIWNHKTGKKITKVQTIGYKNMTELKTKLTPMVLRRTEDDLTDVRIPEVMPPTDVWLDLHPAQRAKYTELQEGVIKLLREEGDDEIKHVAALAKVTYGQEICAGLPALHEPDGPEASTKLDWIMGKLSGEWVDRKIVVFMKNVGLVDAFEKRLADAGIGFAQIRGGKDYANAAYREAETSRFWDDPACRVIIGTTAIERSLNLQVANTLVFVDLHLNPARITQIVGRIRRAGSLHRHIFVFNLLTVDTQEERYLPVLEARQALADYVFDDTSELFRQLSPYQLLELLRP